MEHETPRTEAPVGLPVVIVDIGIDVNDLQVMTEFWETLVGFQTVRRAHNYSYLVNPSNVGPHLFLQLVPEARTEKNRLHLDIVVPSLPEAVRRAETFGAVQVAEFRTRRSPGSSSWRILKATSSASSTPRTGTRRNRRTGSCATGQRPHFEAS